MKPQHLDRDAVVVSIAVSAATGPVAVAVAVSMRSPSASVARNVCGCDPHRLAGRSAPVHSQWPKRSGPALGA